MLPNFLKNQITSVIKWKQCYCMWWPGWMAISSLCVVARLNGYFLTACGGQAEWLFPRCLAVGGQDPPLAPSKFSGLPSPKACLLTLNKETAGLLQLAKVNRTLPYTSDTNGAMPPTAYMCLAPFPNYSDSGGSQLLPLTRSLCVLKHGMLWIKKDWKDMTGTSPAVWWLRLCASTAGGEGSTPGWRTKITCAMWRGKNKTKQNRHDQGNFRAALNTDLQSSSI